MENEEIKDRLKTMIVDRLSLKIDPAEVTDNKPLFRQSGDSAPEQGLDLDSVEALELIVGIEELFDVTIDEGDYVEEFYSVNTLAKFTQKLLTESTD